jgi:hypothetical protein
LIVNSRLLFLMGMTKPKNLRAIDQASFATKNRDDFIARKHGLTVKHLYALIPVIFLIAICVAALVYYNLQSASGLCVVIGFILLVSAKYSERHKKALETTEFLNALFSSTLAAGYKFCTIVKQDDGQIVYLNNGFQKMFPEMLPMPKRSLDLLFAHYPVPENKRETVTLAVRKGEKKEVPVSMVCNKSKKKTAMTLILEPIPRPAGFTMIRGR